MAPRTFFYICAGLPCLALLSAPESAHADGAHVFVTQSLTSGFENGESAGSHGVAVDARGYVCVTDLSSSSMQKLGPVSQVSETGDSPIAFALEPVRPDAARGGALTLQTTFPGVDRSLGSASQVRVTTLRAQFIVRDVRVDAVGVNWATVVDRGTLDSLGAPGALAWGEVLELDRSTHRGWSGAKTGAIWLGACAALGVGVAAAVAGADIYSVGAALFGGLLGAGVGAVIGGLIGTPVRHWEQIYP